MGINGLLKGLKPYTRQGNVREFSGKALVVDASSWLHKSVYSIADHYVEKNESGHLDDKCINVAAAYIFRRCDELIKYAEVSHIFLVMDGLRCPLKNVTNQDREQRRRANLSEARRLKKANRRRESEEKYRSCIKIGDTLTIPVMARVRQKCIQTGLDSLVTQIEAPYEADAQMVRICVDGVADAIVTEDSDVLVYLAACHASFPILFKLQRDNGDCDITSMDWLLKDPTSNPFGGKRQNSKKKTAPTGFEAILDSMRLRQKVHPGRGVRLFVQACVLSGCDYAPNLLNGVGIVGAFNFVREHSHRSPNDLFQSILSALPKNAVKGIDIQQYAENLAKSEAVFFFHPVRTADNNTTTLLSPRNEGDGSNHVSKFYPDLGSFKSDLSFLGSHDDMKSIRKALTENSNVTNSKNPSQLPTCKTDTGAARPPLKEVTLSFASTNNRAASKPTELQKKRDKIKVHDGAGDDDCREIMNTFRTNNLQSNEDRKNKAAICEPVPSRSSTNPFDGFEYRGENDVRFAKRIFSKDRSGHGRSSETRRSDIGTKQISMEPERSRPNPNVAQVSSAPGVRVEVFQYEEEEIEDPASHGPKKAGEDFETPIALSDSESISSSSPPVPEVIITEAATETSVSRCNRQESGATRQRSGVNYDDDSSVDEPPMEEPEPNILGASRQRSGYRSDDSSVEEPESNIRGDSRQYPGTYSDDLSVDAPAVEESEAGLSLQQGRGGRKTGLNRTQDRSWCDEGQEEFRERITESKYFVKGGNKPRRVTIDSEYLLDTSAPVDLPEVIDVDIQDSCIGGQNSFDYGDHNYASMPTKSGNHRTLNKRSSGWLDEGDSVQSDDSFLRSTAKTKPPSFKPNQYRKKQDSYDSDDSFLRSTNITKFRSKPYQNPKKLKTSEAPSLARVSKSRPFTRPVKRPAGALARGFQRQEKIYSQDSGVASIDSRQRNLLSSLQQRTRKAQNLSRKKPKTLSGFGFNPLAIRQHEKEDDF